MDEQVVRLRYANTLDRRKASAFTLQALGDNVYSFESQNSGQTLAEGLAEYYGSNPDLAKGCGLSPEARKFFRNHDTVHVVYGCGASLSDEGIVKLSSIFGTTGGFSVLKGYRLYESGQIYKKLGIIEILLTILRSAIFIPRTIFRCRRQHKHWPWDNYDNYLHVPLTEIRQEFGICVARGITPSGAARDQVESLRDPT